MESEIAAQPHLLHAFSETSLTPVLDLINEKRPDSIVLVARGSSDNAALYARYVFEIHLGIPVSLAAPSVITRHGATLRYPGRSLVIGISQSGAAPDVSEVLAYARAQGHATLAITNTAGSRLTQEAEATVLLGAETENAVAATKTYTLSVYALYRIAQALQSHLNLGNSLTDSALPDDAWLAVCREAAEIAKGPVHRSPVLFSLARGYGFSTAQETALKLMECALLPCKPFSTADFSHGPKALATSGTAAIVYGDEPEGIADQGCLLVQAPRADHAGVLAPVWEIIFGQYLALTCARDRGLDPDRPENLSKVTLTL